MIPANSVSRALALVGDRWSLLILAAAFQGVHNFEGWRGTIGIASNVLAARLRRLVAAGCLRRHPVAGDGRRSEYRLTAMGLDFYATALMFWRFDSRWSAAGQAHARLQHVGCGQLMTPLLVCAECREPVQPWDVRYEPGPGAGLERLPPPKTSRRSKAVLDPRVRERLRLLSGELIDYFADRWTQQILASFFLGARRYNEICASSQAATNIVASRLRLLVEHGMLQRRVYQLQPRRHEYVLTRKGMDVYPIILTFMYWGDRWLDGGRGPPLRLWHRPCGAALAPLVVCDQCQGVLRPNEVTIAPPPAPRPRRIRRAP
jgi:DNA-binding HxlR family transcriptional regulator